MSTYVLMRILESAPQRYEIGIKLLTLGRVSRAYDRLANHVREGQRVLDLGCGTGALTRRAAQRGARVKGIDINSEMLAVANRRIGELGLSDRVELEEMGLAEIDGLAVGSFDVVMSGLCFSELSEDELDFTLKQVLRILTPEGRLIVADEIRPAATFYRLIHGLIRAPLAAVAYLITGQTTRALVELPERVESAGLIMESIRTSAMGSFIELVARKRESSGS